MTKPMLQPQPPPMPINQQTMADESHMNTLSVLHYVLGGLGLLGIVFLVLHFAFMATIFTAASNSQPAMSAPPAVSAVEVSEYDESRELLPDPDPQGEIFAPSVAPPTPSIPATGHTPFPKEAMMVLVAFYIFFGILIIAFCIGNVLSGYWIKKRKNRTFSFLIAAMNCIQFPFGTALGVFTFIVLARPTVQSSYEINRQV